MKYRLKDRAKEAAISAAWGVITADWAVNTYIEQHPDWRQKKFFTICSGWDGDKAYRIRPDEVEEALDASERS